MNQRGFARIVAHTDNIGGGIDMNDYTPIIIIVSIVCFIINCWILYTIIYKAIDRSKLAKDIADIKRVLCANDSDEDGTVAICSDGSDILCASTLSDCKKAKRYINSADETSLNALISSGSAFDIIPNTKAVVLETNGDFTKVRLVDGVYEDSEVWVSSEAISGN